MEQLLQDLKYGLRTLARSPGFTLIAVLSLALGIGANTAIFTLTDAVFLNPLPVQDSSRVIELFTVDHVTVTTAANLTRTPMSFKNYLDFREQNDLFSGLAGFVPAGVSLTGNGEAKPLAAMLVTANYFDVLGVRPALGRAFFPTEDQKPGGNPVAVLSHSLWTREFGADRGILGRTISLNLTPYTVIGVAPPNFRGTFTVGNPNLVWLPVSMHSQVLDSQTDRLFNERRFRAVSVFGRLKPGVAPQSALAPLKTIASRLEHEYPRENNGRSVEVSSLQEAALGFLPRDQVVIAGIALTAVVGLVLLIACVNLANLLMARSSKRAREMGIRTALGAGRGRLIRQLVTESLLLSVAGGIGGLLIGLLGYQLLWSFRPAFLQQNSLALGLDGRVFIFTALVTLLTGILFGLVPAIKTSTPDLASMLKTGGRAGTEPWARSPLRSALVVSEVALALVALVGAGLFIRSMHAVQKTDPGFESKNLFTFNFDLAPRHYSPDRSRQFFRTVMERTLETPGVTNAAVASNPPLGGGVLMTTFSEGQQANPDNHGTLTILDSVSPSYFETVGIALVNGRVFSDFDRADSAQVAVVNQAMEEHFWPGQSAIGKRFHFVNDPTLHEVVGVVKNSAVVTIGEEPQPVIYLPLDQRFSSQVTLHVRTGGNPSAILPAVLARVQALDNSLVLGNPLTIQENLVQGLWAPRMGAALFGIFGLLGMVLASIGIYGVMAYLVAQRTNEIGIRMALGARPGDVLRLVVGHGMRLVAVGIIAGVLSALALTRLMRTLLFDVSPADPLTFIAVSLALAAVAFLAGFLPALRAARIDPVLALRE
jgi:predicted permease